MRLEAGSMIREAAREFGDRVALRWAGGSSSFAEANERANRVGSGLKELGLQVGDRVGVLAFNTPEVVYSWLGMEKHGLVRVVLHSHFDMSAHVSALNHVEARAIVFDSRFAEALAEHRSSLDSVGVFVAIGPNPPAWAVSFDEMAASGSRNEPFLDVDEDEPVFLQLTSGTTGAPKAWIKTHRSWHAVINQNLHHLDTFGPSIPPVGPDDVNVHFHPIQWASGFQTLYPYWVRGATTVLVDDELFDPSALAQILLSEGATGALIPAPMLPSILDALEDGDLSSNRFRRLVIFFATPEQLQRLDGLLGQVWCHGFGSTEQGAVTTRLLASDLDGHPERIASVGRPGSPFIEVAILNEAGRRLPPGELGEIAVRSAMSVGSYWGLPEKTKESFFDDDWFRPFDVGHIDEDGFLYYVDRAGDRILTDQGVVFPHQVENAMLRHPAVRNVGVVGLGEPGSEKVVAAVLLKDGTSGTDDLVEAILEAAAQGLAAHAKPAQVVFVAELPTVLGGAKVQRGALKESLETVAT